MLKLVVFRAYGAAWLPFSFSLPTDPGQPSARPVDDHDEKLLGIRRPGPARRRKITQPERDGIETRDEKPPKPCNPSCVSIRVSPVSSSAVMVNDRACLAPAGVRGCSLCPSFGGGYIHCPARKLIAELVHTAALQAKSCGYQSESERMPFQEMADPLPGRSGSNRAGSRRGN